ncbi:MAG: DUF2330 domain-containing protein [Myxococcota bacterium]
MMRWIVLMAAAGLVLGGPQSARAFCGFYVSGADASLYNNATMVVMMRDGTRTVLSMQNSYQGPPEDFAMVVPVPEVLQEENVKTLPQEVFTRVDNLAAPRLVEYWEQDPCNPRPPVQMLRFAARATGAAPTPDLAEGGLGVTVEAEFAVGEYDIQILSAQDSSGLDTWLRQENYNIPQGAEEVLRPYVAQGTKFFVAKVDSERVTFEDGRVVLSPLRVHYDSDEFSLPVRLGLLNSSGQQDLIVHILARNQRFEVANYNNVTIPTNIRVKSEVRDSFGEFYDRIFRRATAQSPRTVVTEYSWDAMTCDPCPTPALNPSELTLLGADVLPAGGGAAPTLGRARFMPSGFVLTRLHYRYGREGLNEDLVFREAPSIVGGRGIPDREGNLTEEGSSPGSINNFQGRYVMLNHWEGELSCDEPQRGLWGGPPGGGEPPATGAGNAAMRQSTGAELTAIGMVVEQDIPEIQVTAGQAEAALANDPGPPGGAAPSTTATPIETTTVVDNGPGGDPPSTGGCASCAAGSGGGGLGALAFGALLAALWLRRRTP